MARIRNLTLTPELTEQLLQELEVIPDAMIEETGRSHLAGGFTKARAIRERLAALVKSETALDKWFLGLLALSLPCRLGVAAFSAQALQDLFEPLARLVGRERLLLSLLVDEREEVQRLGVEQAKKARPPTGEQDPTAARRSVASYVSDSVFDLAGIELKDSPLLDALGKLFPPDELEDRPLEPPGPAESSVAPASAEALRGDLPEDGVARLVDDRDKTIQHLEARLQEKKRRGQAALKRITESAHRKLRKVEERVVELEQGAARLETENADLRARLEQAAQERAAAIAEGIEDQTSLLRRKWLAEPIEIEQFVAAAASRGEDLLTRTDTILAAQADQDRHTGNRQALAGRLAALRQARDRLVQAGQTAICPVPGLSDLLAEVEAEMQRIEKRLSGQWPADPVSERLILRVNQASTWDELHECRELVEGLADRGFLPHEQRRVLYDVLHRKYSLLEERHAAATGPRQTDTGWTLRRFLHRNQPCLLLLDGHNILFGLQDLFLAQFEDDRPGSKARERLVQIARRLAEPRPNVQLILCFDGPMREVRTLRENFKVAFSGGDGENRADHLIVELLEVEVLPALDQKSFVVTDDRQLRTRILERGARFVPVDVFAVLLQDFHCF